MIYLDNGATTPLCKGARDGIAEAIAAFGNPSSLHFAGLASKDLKEQTSFAKRFARAFKWGDSKLKSLAELYLFWVCFLTMER